MSTENVAILFTDVVGSTELSQRLSAEAADEVRRGHFSLLRQAITESGGTEVKNLGDGLMVVFRGASAALGCAVAMQQGVEQDNRGVEHPVGLRVGLSGGEVSQEEGDYFGDPVVEAARLCARCESGQILATQWLRLTAGRRNRHQCRSLGELTLKGLPDPVETVEVVWERLGGDGSATSIPLPARLAVRPAVGVVGRESEMTTITEALKRVTAGGSREVLLVSGEAGLGKTTLVAEAARAAFENGACVLFGHCEEDLATPYQLFAEALGHYVTFAPEEALLSHVAIHGSELSRLVPALASRIPALPRPRPPTPTPSGSCSSPPWWACWALSHSTNPSSSSSTTSSGPTRGACSCSLTWPPPMRPWACSCSGPTATANCPAPPPWWTRWPACGATKGSRGSTWSGWTTPEWWPSWKPEPDTDSTMLRSGSPMPSTARPTATRSS